MTLPSVGHAFIERTGVNLVASIVNDAHCLWRETLMHDVGIDGQIEYVNAKNEATGRMVLVQVKTGTSYFDSATDKFVSYYPAEKHRNYWEQAPLPVILVLHNPDSRETYWIDARSTLRGRVNKDGPIKVPKTQNFDKFGVLGAIGPFPQARSQLLI
ncbi:DUF4365 domain-containing protein [Paenarthrobacter ilicis]|uniref:DUF4365 domain-containing protein n=1 Tax=Paenarthrobacter ilicis TaxID=43665 RepID=UPI0028D1C00C|nr:DUF4365 domain-containing protein [Paenarthrobacter ilicis]